jgi:hypothetical protein
VVVQADSLVGVEELVATDHLHQAKHLAVELRQNQLYQLPQAQQYLLQLEQEEQLLVHTTHGIKDQILVLGL